MAGELSASTTSGERVMKRGICSNSWQECVCGGGRGRGREREEGEGERGRGGLEEEAWLRAPRDSTAPPPSCPPTDPRCIGGALSLQ